jgi:histidinol-phosphatase
MMSDRRSEELETALRAARAAADISRHYFLGNFEVRTKTDRTPVTQADVECEQAIRRIILDRFPDHGFFGEETGRSGGDDNLWLVDPIDGTKAFVRGYPLFSTQIALMRGGRLVLGVSSGALFEELACAEAGHGAWLNGARLRVSDIDGLSRAALSTGNLRTLAASESGWARFGEVVTAVDRIRGYGDFYQYHLLAAGKIDAVIESDVGILDIAALAVIVEEAGGVFTDLSGRPIDLETTSVLAANPALHGELLRRLGPTREAAPRQ